MPMTFSALKSILLACAIVLGCAASGDAKQALVMQVETETEFVLGIPPRSLDEPSG